MRATEDVKPFTSDGTYHNDYDTIINLPFYREATDLHVKWIKAVPGDHPYIIEAGGGTGNMTAAAVRAVPNAEIQLLDLNPAMTKFAQAKGIPAENIHIADITNMVINGQPVPAGSVDHVFSHSVIWGLPEPNAFFKEAARVLHPGGTLAVSTVLPFDKVRETGFIKYLEKHMDSAVAAGRVTQAQRDNFINSNRQIAKAVKHPLSIEDLKKLGADNGLELVESHPAYVIETTRGAEPFFTQVLFRKKSP